MVKQSTIDRNEKIRKRFQELKEESDREERPLKDKEIHAIIADEQFVDRETVRQILMLGVNYSRGRHPPKARACMP